MDLEAKTLYFEKPGSTANTDKVLQIARQRAEELGIEIIVIASTTGSTAVKAAEVFDGMRVVAVSHSFGFNEPNQQEFFEENRLAFEGMGGILITTTHAFGGISRAMRKKFGTYAIGDIIANTLRIFGEGMKVACEISLMAADSGQVRTDEDIVAIGGTNRGADTAVVLRPVHSHEVFDLRIKEIICKPRL